MINLWMDIRALYVAVASKIYLIKRKLKTLIYSFKTRETERKPNAEIECAYNNDTFSINEIVDKTFATFYPTVLIELENQNLKEN